MTFRSVMLGLAMGALICGVTFFNDFVLRGTFLVGNYMPISVFGGLLVLVLAVNPALRRLRKRWALAGSELAVIVALALVACAIPGRGLMHYFTTARMLPLYRNATDPAWSDKRLLADIPPELFADATAAEIDAFRTGLGNDEGNAFTAADIPWRVWRRTLSFWIPLLASMYLGTMALGLVMHRQWSTNERLRYPISEFAHALMPDEDATPSRLLTNRLFWIAAISVVLIHLNNYTCLYYPETMAAVPLKLDLGPLGAKINLSAEGGMAWLMSQPFHLTAVGFAYFLSADLSLSLGLAPYVWAVANTIATRRGLPLAGGFFSDKPRGFIHAGAFMGIFLMILYSGRRYFSRVLARAVCPILKHSREAPPSAVWAARAFLVAIACFVLQLVAGAEVYWPLAVGYALGAVIIYTVLSRIVAETGTFFIHAYHFPGMVLLGFLGLTVVDLRSLSVMFLCSGMMFMDPREAAMPFMVTGLKLAELNAVPRGRTGAWAGVALLVAFAVALPVTLYIQYDHGANNVGDGWTNWAVPYWPLDNLLAYKTQIQQDPTLAGRQLGRSLASFADARPNGTSVTAFACGLAAVLAMSFLRLRYPWWPLHPVIFAVLGTFQSTTLSASFLLGWAIKGLVTRLAGSGGYQRGKAFMVGLIAGDVLGAILPMIHGAIYYYVTNVPPPVFRLMPS